MQSYRELIIWQKGMQLVKSVYQIVRMFPKDELYGLSDQLRRAAVSIPSNIAEGYGRNSKKDFSHFLSIARGSVFEVETQIRIAVMLELITSEQAQEALNLSTECSKILTAMIGKLSPE